VPLPSNTSGILSASGKGGVGKTLVAIAVAAALAKRCRTGLLDLDIRSPNLMPVLGVNPKVRTDKAGRPYPEMIALDGHNVPAFSSSMLFGKGLSITMGGDQMVSLIHNVVNDMLWPALDYLVIDMDPSSGDTLKGVTKSIRHVSALIVTTSDVSSLADCARMLDACETYGVQVHGVIGNMIGVRCPGCGKPLGCRTCGADVTFGDVEPVANLAKDYRVPVLGELPWDPEFKFHPVATVLRDSTGLFGRIAEVVLRETPP
jgi:ATP-binding protein involved in chromosome partitioning